MSKLKAREKGMAVAWLRPVNLRTYFFVNASPRRRFLRPLEPCRLRQPTMGLATDGGFDPPVSVDSRKVPGVRWTPAAAENSASPRGSVNKMF